MGNHFKQKKGITLIALVITIIVLLILAGISISMLSGDNGILQKTTTAKENTEKSQIEERIKLAYHSALTGGKGSYTKDSLMEELKNEFETDYDVDDSNKDNWILTAKGQSVTIPAGQKEEVKTATLQGRSFWQGGNLYKAYGGSAYSSITSIVHSVIEPTTEIKEDENHLWSTEDSENGVYFWIDNNIMYWWSEAERIYLNEDCSSMFNGWRALSSIEGIENFDSGNTRNMYMMFTGCSLTSLDLSNWDTSNVTNMQIMFSSCSSLTTIYASDKFVTTSVTNSNNMFGGCDLLVGGSGTKMSDSIPGEAEYYDATRACIDTATYDTDGNLIGGTPGYFTSK